MNEISIEKSKSVLDGQALEEKEKHFVEDEIFQKLLAIRESIYLETEINVSPRKLVNMLLKKSDFDALRDQLIRQYS